MKKGDFGIKSMGSIRNGSFGEVKCRFCRILAKTHPYQVQLHYHPKYIHVYTVPLDKFGVSVKFADGGKGGNAIVKASP